MKIKSDNRKKLALLYLLRIRAIRESKLFNLKRFFSKWNYITIIEKERSINFKDLQNKKKLEDENDYKDIDINIKTNIDKIKNDNIKKIKGLMQVINGSDRFIKKKVLEQSNKKIKKYLNEKIKENKLINILKIKEKNTIRKYLYIFSTGSI